MRLDLVLNRFLHGDDSTLGELYIGAEFFCFTCEDEAREIKVVGETRVPAGEYEIELRTESSPMNRRYAERFDFHRGMLWLRDVPDFSYVYLHVGNDDDDTHGCPLVGMAAGVAKGGGYVMRSVEAYTQLYPVILDALNSGSRVFINIIDGGVPRND